MARLLTVVGLIILIAATATPGVEAKAQPRVELLSDSFEAGDLRPFPRLATQDTCVVRQDIGMIWLIFNWVTGNELYKSYLDPSLSCANPYPFTITEINMPLWFPGPTVCTASVDIELVDNSTPNCPFPGELIAISPDYTFSIPDRGLWNLWVPLEEPVVVNGPFFAGFYIGSTYDEVDDSVAVVVDSMPVSCVSYNAWDTTIGWVDLVDEYSFPGRLILYASGVPSAGPQPPNIEFLEPQVTDTLFGHSEIWLRDRFASWILDEAIFEYREYDGGPYAEIGRDLDGYSPLRNGDSAVIGGSGFSYIFDFGLLGEGEYMLRGTVFDTLSRSDVDSVRVYLEPTPPVPEIVSHDNGDVFCSPLSLAFVCGDEDVDFLQAFRKPADPTYSAGLVAASTAGLGNKYVGPLAAAVALKLWYDRGYTEPLTEAGLEIPIDTAAKRLAERFNLDFNGGTYDEQLYAGLRAYLNFKRSDLELDHLRNPDYFEVRDWVENQERAVLLGVSGDPGTWLTVDGFDGLQQTDGSYLVRVANPLSGTLEPVAMRGNAGTNELFFGGSWHAVDIMVSVTAPDWTVSRTSIGVDLDGANGWSITWTTSGLAEGDLLFVHAAARDQSGMRGTSTKLLQYACSAVLDPGDYNNDGNTDILDAGYLLSFIAKGGATPMGGAGRADANCDGYVNIADVIYFLNYLLGSAAPPCY